MKTTKRRRGRPVRWTADQEASLQRAMDRRGSQTFVYHVHSTTVLHWWDHGEMLNNVQFTMEEMFGPIVELVGIQTERTAGTDGRKHVMIFYFKIGPLPPFDPFPVNETTITF